MAKINNRLCDRTSWKFNGILFTRMFGAKVYSNPLFFYCRAFEQRNEARGYKVIDEGVHLCSLVLFLFLGLYSTNLTSMLILVNISLTFCFVVGEMRRREENDGVSSLLSFVKGKESEQHKVFFTQLLKLSQNYSYFSDHTLAKNKEKFTRQ